MQTQTIDKTIKTCIEKLTSAMEHVEELRFERDLIKEDMNLCERKINVALDELRVAIAGRRK